MIAGILELIKKQTGIELQLCDYFAGIKEHNGKKYFNVILKERNSESKEFELLKRFSKQYKIIDIEPNGLNRLAIIIN